MTITTKAALADELSVTRARVSQYVKMGMPVRSDGKLDRDEALNWLNRNMVGVKSQEDRGVNRAAQLAKLKAKHPQRPKIGSPQPAPELAPEPSAEDEAARLALAWTYRLHARIVAASVLEAGGSIEVAFAAARIAHSPTVQNLGLVLRYLGHPDFQGDEPNLGLREIGAAEPDWQSLAERGGLTFDRGRCEAHLAGRPIENTLAEPPHTFEAEFTLADLTDGTPYGAL